MLRRRTDGGAQIDEQALVVALKNGEIGGAGLDAFVQEPPTLKEYRELFALENVVVLSHWCALFLSVLSLGERC